MFPKKGSLFPFVKSKMKENHHISFLTQPLSLFPASFRFPQVHQGNSSLCPKLICLSRQHASPSKALHTHVKAVSTSPFLSAAVQKQARSKPSYSPDWQGGKEEAIFSWASQISLMSTWKAEVLQELGLRRFEYNRTGRGCSEESVQTEEIMPCYEGIKKLILANFSCSIQQIFFSML